MKRFYLICLFLLGAVSVAFPQSCDTLIVNSAYTSCFNKTLREPVYVSYKIYKAGGKCSRKGMEFWVDDFKGTATPNNYESSGYDKGHLAPAADFADDCFKEELTFRFYNAVPQNPHLNRGVWKKYESEIRKASQTDSLLVITGSIFGGMVLPNSHVAIPTYCWKVVQSLSTKKILYCFLLSNDDKCILTTFSLADLQTRIKYTLPIKN